jgi:transmembrane sensor
VAAAAAVVVAVLAPLGWRTLGPTPAPPARVAAVQPPGRIYQTGVGERLTINLADGSTAVLNTASRLQVAYTDQERRLVLEAGEGLFDVAKGQPRPFVVAADGHSITAHGTQFDVRLAPDQVKVALVEGVVSVKGRDPAAEVRLKPNEVLVARGETTSVRAVSDMAALVGWRDGLVFFDNATLADAAAEMNRYIERPRIEVEPSVARVRLSGAFRTDQSATFIEALEQGFPVAVVARSPDHIVLGRSRRAAAGGG